MATQVAGTLGTRPAAAAAPVMPLIQGPRQAGRVLGAFDLAVIIAVDTTTGPRVVSLLADAASGVPNGVRLGSTTSFPALRAGSPAWVGEGEIRAGEIRVRVVRCWPTRVRRVTPHPRALTVLEQGSRARELGVPAIAVEHLAGALRAEPQGPGARTARAAEALLGLGAGLTPGGDDVLAGVLIGLHATGRPDLARSLGEPLLATAQERTTLLSAELLRLATGGDACLEALAVLHTLHDPRGARFDGSPHDRLRPALHRLLSVGHTSGADLTAGLMLGLRYGMTEQHLVACDDVIGRHL